MNNQSNKFNSHFKSNDSNFTSQFGSDNSTLKTKIKTTDVNFNSSFTSNQTKFNGNFKTIDSSSDIDLDLLIIFDGGGVDGYETSLENNI